MRTLDAWACYDLVSGHPATPPPPMSPIPACKNCEHYYEDEFLFYTGFCKFHYFESPDYINGRINKIDMMAHKVREDEDLCGHEGKDFKEREVVKEEKESKSGFWEILRRIF